MTSYRIFVALLALSIAPKAFGMDAPQPLPHDEQVQAQEQPQRAVRLVLPWSRMETLTDAQKQQIDQIRRQAREEIRAIEQREREQIVALLSEEQKTELQTIEDERAAERRARDAERRARARQAEQERQE